MPEPMANVYFSEQLQQRTGGVEQIEVFADTYRDLVAKVGERFPELYEDLAEHMSVAIDGVISHEPFLEPIEPDSEVHFLPRLAGG